MAAAGTLCHSLVLSPSPPAAIIARQRLGSRAEEREAVLLAAFPMIFFFLRQSVCCSKWVYFLRASCLCASVFVFDSLF